MKMWILVYWKIICQGLKLLNLQLWFNFSYKWPGLNIFVLVNFFLSKWFTGLLNPYLIQNLFFNGIYIIFQGIQFFFKFLLHAFHFLFQPRQLEFHNFTFFENPDFKIVQLVEITPNETLIFQNLWVWNSYLWYTWISSFQIYRFHWILIFQEEMVERFSQFVDFRTFQDS